MDSSYKQTRIWMNNRDTNNGNSDSWRDPGPERSSLSMAGWSPYANTSRRPLMSNDIPENPQVSGGTPWGRAQADWNEISGCGPNSWPGPSNGDNWSDSRVMQQQQQSVQMHNDIQELQKGQRDRLLHGFNSAGRDWLYRYMQMGCTPEEARDRVLERNRNRPESLEEGAPHGGRHSQVKRMNPSSERSRLSEFGTESLTEAIRNLNKPCRRWFNRHLKNGCTTEDALAKVLEHKKSYSNNRSVTSSTDIGGRKRPAYDDARVESIKPKKAKELPQVARVSSEKDCLSVAVAAKDYTLQSSELNNIEQALIEEMKKGWTHSLNFGGLKFLPGMLVVTCLDTGSKEWIELMVPKIGTDLGLPLWIYKENETPDSKAITFYVPRTHDEPDEVTLRFIKDQNTDLLSGSWSILSTSTKTKNGKVMNVQINDKSLDLLSKRGMKISYRFMQITCRVNAGPVCQPIKEKAEKETIPNPTAEIDLTEEDGDEDHDELADMTVLDEVLGDDDDEENGGGEEEAKDEVVEVEDNEEEDVNKKDEPSFEEDVNKTDEPSFVEEDVNEKDEPSFEEEDDNKNYEPSFEEEDEQ